MCASVDVSTNRRLRLLGTLAALALWLVGAFVLIDRDGVADGTAMTSTTSHSVATVLAEYAECFAAHHHRRHAVTPVAESQRLANTASESRFAALVLSAGDTDGMQELPAPPITLASRHSAVYGASGGV